METVETAVPTVSTAFTAATDSKTKTTDKRVEASSLAARPSTKQHQSSFTAGATNVADHQLAAGFPPFLTAVHKPPSRGRSVACRWCRCGWACLRASSTLGRPGEYGRCAPRLSRRPHQRFRACRSTQRAWPVARPNRISHRRADGLSARGRHASRRSNGARKSSHIVPGWRRD